MRVWAVLLLAAAGVTAEDVDLSTVEEYELTSPGFPAPIPPNTKLNWVLTVPPGERIDFSCYDIRLHQNDPNWCDEDERLTLFDTMVKRVVCGNRYDLAFVTASWKLMVELKTGSDPSGGVQCTARMFRESTPRPTTPKPNTQGRTSVELQLEAGGEPRTVTSPEYSSGIPPLTDHTWRFSTTPGSRIRITCSDIRLFKTEHGCNIDRLEVTDGEEVQEICGGVYDFTKLSSGHELSMRLRTGDYPSGGVKCEVKGVVMDWYGEATPPPTTTPPPPPPYLDIESEEVDSSEHGGPQGPKATTCKCGWTNKASKRVVGGRETGVNEYPFIVGVIYRGQSLSFCGGSIVTPYHVLTAAHCTRKPQKYGHDIAVVVGEHDQAKRDETDATQVIDVVKIIDHENYNHTLLKHDISLLVLERKIEFNQFVGPVCLSRTQLSLARQYVKIIGWGLTSWSGNWTTKLQKVDARVIHMESCNDKYGLVSVENPTQICTYSHDKGACMGDSGGPLVWLDPETNRYTQVGVVSFGRVCGSEDPNVYTDVSYYVEWMYTHISATHPGEMCFKKE